MTRKKKLLIAALLLVLVAGSWFYYAVYVSTDSVLARAEAFRFRRMTVSQLEERDSYRYFFVTNRDSGDADGDLESTFGRERSGSLSFGRFDTRIRPTLGLGMLINPTQWMQDEEIRIDNLDLLERAEFTDQLRRLVSKSPRKSLLIVVHGFREAFPSALRKTAFVGHVLDINSPVLLFDWPGNQGSTPRGYLRAHDIAAESGTDLVDTIRIVLEEVEPDRLWLLANSMGAQVVVDALSQLYQDPEFADLGTELEDVILTAPDVDAADFDNRFRDEIAAITEDLTVYVSSNDRALIISRILNRAARSGESTLSPDQLEEAVKIAALVEPGGGRISLVDVTPVNRTRNFHNFSLETPEFFDDLFLRLTTKGLPESRPIYPVRSTDGRIYWVLTPGR